MDESLPFYHSLYGFSNNNKNGEEKFVWHPIFVAIQIHYYTDRYNVQ